MCYFNIDQTLANCNCPQGSTSIGTTGVISDIDLSLEIVDGLGRSVLTKKDLHSGINHIDVYELPDGIYSVILRQSNKMIGTSSLVKVSLK